MYVYTVGIYVNKYTYIYIYTCVCSYICIHIFPDAHRMVFRHRSARFPRARGAACPQPNGERQRVACKVGEGMGSRRKIGMGKVPSGIYICTQVCRYDYVICISMCNKYTAYHPILQHDNGKSPFSICKSTINGPFSIALRLSVKPAEVLDKFD